MSDCMHSFILFLPVRLLDPEVSIRVLLTVYLASVPLLSIVLALAAVLQYLFDRYLFNADNSKFSMQ